MGLLAAASSAVMVVAYSQRGNNMRSLATSEIELVDGGVLPLAIYAATFVAAYGAADMINDFVKGFSDAMAD